jgi:hypothetical protein
MSDPNDLPPGGSRVERRARVDLTINIPTMITLFLIVVSSSATGIGMYYQMDKRQMMTDLAVATLVERVNKLEGNQISANNSLRTELKTDIAEIKGMLNRVIFAPPTTSQRQLKEWSKD